MLFAASLFALSSFVHASVAASLPSPQPTGAAHLERRGCAPKKSPTPGPAAAVTFEPFNVDTAQQYRYQKQTGANAGSMFVHEQWMDNTPYQCAAGRKSAELDIASGWGGVKGAQAELESHWDTWITEDYFEKLASMGINTVRLPIGYWSIGKNWTVGTPFEPYADAYVNSWSRVLRTVKWAETHKLGVLIDLHGAPGSQNGQAHSGTSDGKIGLWGNQKYIQKTQAILVWLAQQFQYVNNVVGLELLNEPKYGNDLLEFYKDTIPMIRAVAKTMPIYVHDGFNLGSMTNWVASNCQKWQPVIVDHHHYYVFQQKFKSMPITQITKQVTTEAKSTLNAANKKLNGNLMIGEMGCANAPGQSVSNMDAAKKANCEAQVNTYSEVTGGWHFWALKMADCKPGDGDGWCLLGMHGKYLPSKFVVPGGQISSGGVTITPGTAPTTGSGSGSGSSSGSSSGSTSSSGTSGSTPKSCSANTSTKNGKRSLTARSLDVSADNRRRHHMKVKRQIINDTGYTEGHIAAHTFAAAKRELGFAHAFIMARAEHLGIEEEHIEHFKRGFEEGHATGLEAFYRRR